MFHILKIIKSQWKPVVLIIILLLVQAICDLSLPNYTSRIIDTGIQNSGVEFAAPTVLRSEIHKKMKLFMTEEEAALWDSSYTLDEDGNYHLKDSSDSNLELLDESFALPIALAYMTENAASKDASAIEQMISDAASSELSDTKEIRTLLEKQVAALGDSFIRSSAIAFTKAEYAAVGVDLAQMQTSYLWETGSKMLLVSLLMAGAAILVGLFSARVGAGIGRNLREKVFDRVVSFSNAEINRFSTASLITRSTNDIQQLQMMSTMFLRMIVYAPILAIGGIFMVVRTNAGMEWIIFIAVLAILVLVMSLMSIAIPKFKLMQSLVDKVNLIAREILTGLSVIRAFGREDLEEDRFDQANTNLTRTMLFTNRTMTFMMPLMMLIMNGISVLIVWVSAGKIDSGSLEVGTMTAFITYTMQIVMSFHMLCMVSTMLPRAAVAATRIGEILQTETTVCDRGDVAPLAGCRGTLSFRSVSFRYPGAEDEALTNINFETTPGQTTAIIGSTGSGKSTLVQLIPRFYDVTDGSITLDGKDIRDIPQKDLRDRIGYVPQKAVLFSGTVASNLRFGAADATDEQMREAAQIAQASSFIEEKNEQYESAIAQGGSNVSGGQKQRLSIARAIAKDPKIYIFDDSFSALDFKTDTALRRALAPKVKDSTVLIVAQRISTILFADQILVLDEGRLVGKGTHEELLKTCEAYLQIARSQLSEAELEAALNGKGEI